MLAGPILQTPAKVPYLNVFALQQQGAFRSTNPYTLDVFQIGASTLFQTAPQFTNLSALPFTSTFGPAQTFPGQNVSVTSNIESTMGGTYTQARTVTLIPQTVDGTVTSISGSGNYTVYTLSLAPLDTLSALGGFSSLTAYAGTDVLRLNTATPSVGSPLRCTGLVFNDNGTLRMACTQTDDGVQP